MPKIYTTSDIDECWALWEKKYPGEQLTDLWQVRSCFHHRYRRGLLFVTAEEKGEITGLLPLTWIPESGCYGYFPGETWQGKTWLEQNRLIADNSSVLDAMFGALRESGVRYHLRYLLPTPLFPLDDHVIDETGYILNPPEIDYRFENYFQLFSHKTGKRIRREMESFELRNLTVRTNQTEDFNLMVSMNLLRYNHDSYFADARFTESFRDLMYLFQDNGWLRMTTISIDGEVAAVDLGCLYNGTYTLLAGGTNPGFPGIAKYINLYHLRYACEQKVNKVDFLCGEFAWKPMFHLTKRPLYKLSNVEECEIPVPQLEPMLRTSV